MIKFLTQLTPFFSLGIFVYLNFIMYQYVVVWNWATCFMTIVYTLLAVALFAAGVKGNRPMIKRNDRNKYTE